MERVVRPIALIGRRQLVAWSPMSLDESFDASTAVLVAGKGVGAKGTIVAKAQLFYHIKGVHGLLQKIKIITSINNNKKKKQIYPDLQQTP